MHLNKYKLVAFDLDGTLLNSEKQISAYSKKVLKRLHSQGIHFTLATGRLLPTVKQYADELDIDYPLIMSNGSILQTRQGTIINQSFIPRKAIDITIDTCKDEKVIMVAFINNIFYFMNQTEKELPQHKSNSYQKQEIKSWKKIEDKLSLVNKFSIINPESQSDIIRLDEELTSKLTGLAQTVRTGDNIVEFQPYGITKAAGLRKLADEIGIDMQQIIAFGDHNNDVEMLAEVGLGIAVGEATPSCIANADLVVASSDEDGPAHFLEDLFLSATSMTS